MDALDLLAEPDAGQTESEAKMQQIGVALLAILASLLLGCTQIGGQDSGSTGANKVLWNAALETLSFLPVEEADPEAGLLVTGWGRAEGSRQQYRVTVLVADRALDARHLKVAVFRRTARGEVAAPSEQVLEVENAILLRARQLRIEAANG